MYEKENTGNVVVYDTQWIREDSFKLTVFGKAVSLNTTSKKTK